MIGQVGPATADEGDPSGGIGGILFLVLLAACVPIDARRFQVIGRDIYGLDTDHDGIAGEG